tara:strand:- start:637 stop:873 length:237 start_codon:yes stop_codon:yes gene_type:complete
MELTEENVMKVLEDLIPYIEADGGWLEFVEIEEETNLVKIRLGGACESCAMSAMTLKQGIEKKVMMDIPDCVGVVQVL